MKTTIKIAIATSFTSLVLIGLAILACFHIDGDKNIGAIIGATLGFMFGIAIGLAGLMNLEE